MVGYCRRCRKRAYLSERHAEKVADYLRERHGRVLRAYLCPRRCGWHLTKRVAR